MEAIGALIRGVDLPSSPQTEAPRSLYVNRLGDTLLDGVLRLLRLLEAPADIPVLAPMVKQGIFYRLLMNGQGAVLRQLVQRTRHTASASRAPSAC